MTRFGTENIYIRGLCHVVWSENAVEIFETAYQANDEAKHYRPQLLLDFAPGWAVLRARESSEVREPCTEYSTR